FRDFGDHAAGRKASMQADNQLRKLEQIIAHGVDPAGADLGHVVSVGGSDAIVQLPAELFADDESDISVGSYLGIKTKRALAVGVISSIPSDDAAGGSPRASGRVDLLGEIITDAKGAARFQRGVSSYPRVGNRVVPIGERELRLIFDVSGPTTINIGTLQQDRTIGAYVDV